MLLSLLLVRQGFRVALVERSDHFEREFRGEFLQPGALQIMDRLGLLPALLPHGEVIDRYQISEHGSVIMSFSFAELPGAYQFGLNVSQAYVLPLLLSECQKFEEFTFMKRFSPLNLIEHGDQVHGVVVGSPEGAQVKIRSRLVVGADGRNSAMRKLAGLPVSRHTFNMDVLWTKIPRPHNWENRVEVCIHPGGLLVTMPTYPNQLQLGVDMPEGGLEKLREQGLEALVSRLVSALPNAEKELTETLTSWSAFQQLVATGALATQWYKPGLVLMGDAAHTIGPIAGQGVTQALKDAVQLSKYIGKSPAGQVVGTAVLQAFQQARFAEVKSLYTLQSRQERLLMATSFGGRLARKAVYWMLTNTPVRKRLAAQMAMKDVEALA